MRHVTENTDGCLMKILSGFRILFPLIGLAALAGAWMLYSDAREFVATATVTEGTVVELVRSRSTDATTYAPHVTFTDAQGRTHAFTSRTSSNPPAYHAGETVRVLYRSGSPEQARIDGFFSLWGGALIVGVLGGVFVLAGLGMVLVPLLKKRRAARLRNTGRRIEAAFQGVEHNTSLTVNGRHPFCVISQWQNPATSRIHVFRSDNLWFDPSDYITRAQIPVYIDPANPGRYHVDLSFLPALAG